MLDGVLMFDPMSLDGHDQCPHAASILVFCEWLHLAYEGIETFASVFATIRRRPMAVFPHIDATSPERARGSGDANLCGRVEAVPGPNPARMVASSDDAVKALTRPVVVGAGV